MISLGMRGARRKLKTWKANSLESVGFPILHRNLLDCAYLQVKYVMSSLDPDQASDRAEHETGCLEVKWATLAVSGCVLDHSWHTALRRVHGNLELYVD